jgi:hypothetical protein
MMRIGSDPTRVLPSFKVAIFVLTVVSLTLSRPGPASAESIISQLTGEVQKLRKTVTPHVSGDEPPALRQFLAGGQAHWAVAEPPRFPKGLDIKNPDGTLRTSSPVVQYLIWMRDRDPALFDRRHPRIAPLFQQYAQAQAHPQQLATAVRQPSHGAAFQVLIPPTASGDATGQKAKDGSAGGGTSPVPTPAPQVMVPLPAPVPEPAPLASTLLLFGAAGGWWHRRRRASA